MDFDEYEYLEKTVEEKFKPEKLNNDILEEEEERDISKTSIKHYDEENGSEKVRDRKRDRDSERDRDRSSRERRSREREKSSDRRRSRAQSRDRSREKSRERSLDRVKSRDRSREKSRDRSLDREKSRDRSREKSRDRREKSRERSRERSIDRREKSRDRSREKSRDRSLDRAKSRDRTREKLRDRSLDRAKSRDRRSREKSRERSLDRGKSRDRSRERRHREREISRERERGSRSRSRSRHERERERELLRERERELELRESRRYKDKKETAEPEADPERDQRTVFAYQMPLKATDRDVYEFFSKAGKVRDVRLIMDRNSRRSKGVGYIEFYDVMSVPMAIALSGQLLLGQPVMVKPSEAEKNLVQTNASGGASVVGPYGVTERKLYVGNLHFNMTELQLKQIFEPFGPVELIQLPLDPETGHCKGFGFVQFTQLEHAKAATSLNGKLEIAGRTIKVSSVTDHIGIQDTGAKTADFDDDEGGGLALNAQSRALLMQKLDRTGIASSLVGSIGVPALNGAATSQLTNVMPIAGTTAIPAAILTPQVLTSLAPEPIGNPSECLLLKNMFDPTAETDPEFDLDIKDDVYEECSKCGHVKHIHVDKNSAGYVYLRFDSVEGASRAQQAMHKRWFARRLISAIYLQPYEYDAKFKGAA